MGNKFHNIVSTGDKTQDINIKKFKLKVDNTFK